MRRHIKTVRLKMNVHVTCVCRKAQKKRFAVVVNNQALETRKKRMRRNKRMADGDAGRDGNRGRRRVNGIEDMEIIVLLDSCGKVTVLMDLKSNLTVNDNGACKRGISVDAGKEAKAQTTWQGRG